MDDRSHCCPACVDLLIRKIPEMGSSLVKRIVPSGASTRSTGRAQRWPLPTPSGFMKGTYGMVTANGEGFDIEIPAFSLDSGEGRRTIN